MKSGVYVRAKDPNGKWGPCLAEDLDERSFRVLLVTNLAKAGMFVAIKDDLNEPKEYSTAKVHDDDS